MSEGSEKGIYDQSSFDAIKPRLIGTKPNYPATPLENWNDAPGRRDAQFENHCSNVIFLNWDSFPSSVVLLFYICNQAHFWPDRAEYLVLYVFEKMLIATYKVYRSKFSLHTV